MPFGQLIVGPPGSGKSTYVHGMSQFLTGIQRPHLILNLDPANEHPPYSQDDTSSTPQQVPGDDRNNAVVLDIGEFITLEDIMEECKLGPNGGLIACMEYIAAHIDWLVDQLSSDKYKDRYILVDCPGQVELYTVNSSVVTIIGTLSKRLDIRFTCVNLVDSAHLIDPTKYISILLLSLKTMLHLALPHVNVLSKMDLIESYGKLQFNLDFYTEALDLSHLLESLNTSTKQFGSKFVKLNEAICSLLEDFAYVHFHTLCVQDKQSIFQLLKAIDKSNGYVYGALEMSNDSILGAASKMADEWEWEGEVKERYFDNDDDSQSTNYVNGNEPQETLDRERRAMGISEGGTAFTRVQRGSGNGPSVKSTGMSLKERDIRHKPQQNSIK